nr:uncharacterized protein LOC104092214 [Nicotiana tomentosiformis]XP_033510994.1 uncharacterized protein LOC104092214 [Nicotiana tomentosiformis]XP_033510995.1 uncharacterized protein LOC104092214 [Nicotiana tomentosiformis]XP_033510996.1 uncharacterized protein LOC104092214 [Nicotiana tomentosiformis]
MVMVLSCGIEYLAFYVTIQSDFSSALVRNGIWTKPVFNFFHGSWNTNVLSFLSLISIEILCLKKVRGYNSKKKKSGKEEGAFEYFIFKNCVWLKFIFDSGNLQTEQYYGQISIQDSFHK